jgi:hypothetical protein
LAFRKPCPRTLETLLAPALRLFSEGAKAAGTMEITLPDVRLDLARLALQALLYTQLAYWRFSATLAAASRAAPRGA